MFLFDTGYLLFVIPAMVFAMWAQFKVKSTYATYAQVYSRSGRTAAEVAASLLGYAGIRDVRIEQVPGALTDHYDPRNRTLRLSGEVYGGRSVAALSIAAHEVGHAVQHAVGYSPLSIRNGLVPVVQFTSNAAWPLFLVGFLAQSGFLMDLGILFFLGAVVFQVITLPVEYNASRRAMDMLLASGYVGPDESVVVGNMLNAAALTYVAATAVAVAQFLRLLLIRDRRR
ncbi:MAG: zinc metallopeptidase [Bacillota bacterium]